jgi:hypothetical protein
MNDPVYSVNVSATPVEGWELSYWQDNQGNIHTGNPITILMGQDTELTAVFTPVGEPAAVPNTLSGSLAPLLIIGGLLIATAGAGVPLLASRPSRLSKRRKR